jgi:MYXO-CTERM domain-containing protein
MVLACAVAAGGALAPRVADAFCGFYVSGADAKLYNNATMVVLMREGQRTVLSMQNNYQGPPENFAMVVPVPVVLQKENVKTLDRGVFDRVDTLAAPRLVEYWEQDPCALPVPDYAMAPGAMPTPTPAPMAKGAADLGVKIEAQFTVGEYEIVILSAKDAAGLDTWLRQEKYKIPDGSEPYLRPYVQAGMKFFVAKVDVTKVKFDGNMAMLSPLRFHYDSEKFQLPIRLGLVNSNGTQDLIVHILAKGQRYDVANYPNVTVPTNFDVSDAAKGKFSTFYASLFDRTLEKNPKAVVTEYAWDASTCDPCPSPALSYNELATLGADALPSAGNQGGPPPPSLPRMPMPLPQPVPAPKPGSKPTAAPPMPPPPPMRQPWFQPSGFVLTRLHARYGKESLGEDLVFKEAPPITGGREVRVSENELEHGSTAASYNNFQGRYAIRHAWTGPIACQSPKRGNWGGPPPGANAQNTGPKPALNLAFAPRGAQLGTFLAVPVPELDAKPIASAGATPPAPGAPDGGDGAVPGATPAGSRGCGSCAAAPSDGAGALVLGLGTVGILAGLRRRRR